MVGSVSEIGGAAIASRLAPTLDLLSTIDLLMKWLPPLPPVIAH
jgi:hypothetical protein